MPRLLALAALTVPLALALACAGSDGGGGGFAPGRAEPPRTAVNATPAVAPADQEAYRQGVVALDTVQETCGYLPTDAVADCGERGAYKLEPKPATVDLSCVVGLSGESKPEYVLCTNLTGGEPTFFVIQQ